MAIGKIGPGTAVAEVVTDPAFGDFGRLLFPIGRGVRPDMSLKEISTPRTFVWYTDVRTEETVGVISELKRRSEAGKRIFVPIYSEEEISRDPSAADTGLFFFSGKREAPFAVACPGGGFFYVAALHDGLPHALALSELGYNAFTLIYRTECPYDDLARALQVIESNAGELGVAEEGYSLWGGSAGARMAAALGNSGVLASYGLRIPQAAAAVMQYTGYSRVSRRDAPTYACVGTEDWIADRRVMRDRSEALKKAGVDSEFHVYGGLGHGFGMGAGTKAEGWFREAVSFWHMPSVRGRTVSSAQRSNIRRRISASGPGWSLPC